MISTLALLCCREQTTAVKNFQITNTSIDTIQQLVRQHRNVNKQVDARSFSFKYNKNAGPHNQQAWNLPDKTSGQIKESN